MRYTFISLQTIATKQWKAFHNLYRDAIQFIGLNNFQARSKKIFDFHFNAALTAVNLAKYDWLSTKGKMDKPFSMSDYILFM